MSKDEMESAIFVIRFFKVSFLRFDWPFFQASGDAYKTLQKRKANRLPMVLSG
jgi:hypothetical protein